MREGGAQVRIYRNKVSRTSAGILGALVVVGGMAHAAVDNLPRVFVPISNADFEEPLDDTWHFLSENSGLFWRDRDQAHSGSASARVMATQGEAGIFLSQDRSIPVKAGETVKLAGWLRAEKATGNSFLRLEGVGIGDGGQRIGDSEVLNGTTPGWVYRSVVVTVPAERGITHVRPVLRSDNNAGTIWFDDIRLWRLPPDEPIDSGPPPRPPYGQISVRDGHLVGSDGTRVRFWGVNVVDEMGRSYREITHIVRRIRQMGFNAVRLHLHDIRFIDVDAKNRTGENSSLLFRQAKRGDGSLLDKLDYFIYRCEREGLYLYLSFDRRRVKFARGDYEILPSDGPEAAANWKEAVAQLQPSVADEHVYYVDDRLAAAHARYVRQLLDHRNGYTGKRLADDPYIALYELTNENHFPEWMLRGGFRNWPDFFQRLLRRGWNDWLREEYAADKALRAAWDGLGENESLEDGTVEVGPSLDQSGDYSSARLADVHRFVYELFVDYSQRLERVIRDAGTSSTSTPISWDTIHEPKSKWYFPCAQAGVMTVGTYISGATTPERESCPLVKQPNVLTNLSFASVQDKPTVVYETNTMKPDWWRAAYPMQLSAFASTHDWDGVFWYLWSDGTVADQFDDDTYLLTGLRYASVGHQWHGAVIATDEVLLASMRAAGEIFQGFHLPPSADPVVVTLGAGDLLGPGLWTGDVDVPYPKQTIGPWKRTNALGITDFLRTVRYRFDIGQETTALSRGLDAGFPRVIRPVAGLTYDWRNGYMLIDTPSAKAVVGFVEDPISFGDGIELTEIGDIDPSFVCFAIVSTDGRPLQEAQQAVLVLTTYGENRGRVLAADPDAISTEVPRFAKLVESWGVGPPDIARPSATIQLDGDWGWRAVDFLLEKIDEGEGQHTIRLKAGTPVYRIDLKRGESHLD